MSDADIRFYLGLLVQEIVDKIFTNWKIRYRIIIDFKKDESPHLEDIQPFHVGAVALPELFLTAVEPLLRIRQLPGHTTNINLSPHE